MNKDYTVDMTNVKSPFDLIKDGTHEARITGVEVKESQAGNTYLNIELTLKNNQKIWDVAVIGGDNEQAIKFGKWKIKRIFEVGGLKMSNKLKNPHEQMLGTVVGIIVTTRKDDPTRKQIADYAVVNNPTMNADPNLSLIHI